MAGMFVLIMISFALANLQSLLWVNSEWLVSTILPAVVVSETNKARATESLPALTRSTVLDTAAQLKADDMAAHSYFAHNSPDGVTPWHWFAEAGYHYAFAGENLAVHFTDSEAVVDAWLKSPSHRANVMNDKYQEIGIGTAKGEYDGYKTVFVVQLFGTPAAVAPTPVTPQEELTAADTTQPSVAVEPVSAPVPSPEPPAASEQMSEPAPVTPVAPPEETASVTEAGTVVFESYAETETPGAVLAEQSMHPSPSMQLPLLGRLATSPHAALQFAYSLIGLGVMALLMYTLIFEWRHHHPKETAYSAGLLTLMIALFFIQSIISGTAVIL